MTESKKPCVECGEDNVNLISKISNLEKTIYKQQQELEAAKWARVLLEDQCRQYEWQLEKVGKVPEKVLIKDKGLPASDEKLNKSLTISNVDSVVLSKQKFEELTNEFKALTHELEKANAELKKYKELFKLFKENI